MSIKIKNKFEKKKNMLKEIMNLKSSYGGIHE